MYNEFLGYIRNFMNKIEIPSEAKAELMRVENKIFSDESIAEVFLKCKIDLMNETRGIDEVLAAIGSIDEKLGVSEYTLHFVFLINCTDILFENYKRANINEHIFWETMDDFRCKLLECHEVNRVWGTFVAGWFAGFLNMKRFALGRFQYEEGVYKGDTYEKNGIILGKGDRVYNFHIPSSGKPFDKTARLASYRKAFEFYGCKEKGKNLILVCDSWLLHKKYEEILPETSNILDFMHDFDIVSSLEEENFNDSWRVFGGYHKLPIEQWPQDNSLRKAIAGHLLSGEKMGSGYGIVIFDGNNIINH